MSWITLSNKKVKTKKEHVCFGCNTKFPAGTKMNKNVSVDGGDFSSTYMCECCESFMSDKWQYYEDGMGQGDCWQHDDYKEFREKFNQGVADERSVATILNQGTKS